MRKYRRRIITTVLLGLIIAGCSGRETHPIPVVQPGDEERSCTGIQKELDFIESEIRRLVPQAKRKTLDNIIYGVLGVFCLGGSWYEIDLSKKEQVEIEAYRQRYNRLLDLSSEQNCGIERNKIPDFHTIK